MKNSVNVVTMQLKPHLTKILAFLEYMVIAVLVFYIENFKTTFWPSVTVGLTMLFSGVAFLLLWLSSKLR